MSLKLHYKDAAGEIKTYDRDFVSVREAVYTAANTGYLLEASELHIAPPNIAVQKAAGKAPDGGAKGAGGKGAA